MATAVDGYMRAWNATDLDGCQYHNEDYLTSMEECSPSTFVGWRENSTDLNSVKSDSMKPSDADMKQLRHFWRIRQFFNAIQKSWHRPSRATVDALKSFPLILFSPILDRVEQRKDDMFYTGYFTDPNLASPRSASEAELLARISDQQQQQEYLLSDQLRFVRLSNPTRRHCNSESDLTWSPPPDLLPQRGMENFQPESLATKESLDDISDSLPQNSLENLHISEEYEACSSHVAAEHSEYGTDELKEDPGEATVENDENEILSLSEVSLHNAAIVGPTPEQTISVEVAAENPSCFYSYCNEDDDLNRNDFDSQKQDSDVQVEISSIKSCPTPKLPKSVSFADEVGQTLTEVYVIENSDQIRAFEYEAGYDGSMWTSRSRFGHSPFAGRFTRSRLKHRSELFMDVPTLEQTSAATSTNNIAKRTNESTRNLWVLSFAQPASQYFEFRQRIEHGSVSLENITVTQPDESSTTQLPQLSGTIKVKNLSYEKQVWIRLTTDNWRSFTDFVALYSPKLSGGLLHSAARFDTFTFQLSVVPQMETEDNCDKIEFAVRYLVGPDGSWGQYWDNNAGKNYVIEKRVVQSHWPNQIKEAHAASRPLTRSSTCGCAFDVFGDGSSSTTPSHFNPYTQDYRPNFEGISEFTSYRAWTHFADETTYY